MGGGAWCEGDDSDQEITLVLLAGGGSSRVWVAVAVCCGGRGSVGRAQGRLKSRSRFSSSLKSFSSQRSSKEALTGHDLVAGGVSSRRSITSLKESDLLQ